MGLNVYTDEMIDFIREVSPTHTNKETTKLFNEKFGFNINEKNMNNIRKRRKIPTSSDGRFKKGNVPFNKGRKGIYYKGSEATWFKKGNKPHAYKPVGSERIDRDGYVWVKTEDPNKWRMKHVLIWEKHYGEVPKGHIVVFLDKNRLNTDINNLLLVSRAELLMMNRQKLFTSDVELTMAGYNMTKVLMAGYKAKKERRKQ